ncbi:MAG: hypothetical protein ACRYFX_23930 [Janthinobacterium lividum]
MKNNFALWLRQFASFFVVCLPVTMLVAPLTHADSTWGRVLNIFTWQAAVATAGGALAGVIIYQIVLAFARRISN